MLTLNPGCLCDVCAEEYGPHSLPHSIPCGHVLCVNCCNNIISKTSTRLTPTCPFCREQFSRESIRMIRIDFGGSGTSTPRRIIAIEAPDFVTDIFNRKDDSPKAMEQLTSRAREEVRRLENKVARVAAQKSSVEEVSSLHQELNVWLSADAKQENQSSALQLSAALLKAILVNYLSHSETTKAAKTQELSLKDNLEELEAANDRLELELRSLRTQYYQKAQECQNLKAELGRSKISPSPSPVPGFASSSAAAAASSVFRPRSAMAYSSRPVSPPASGPMYSSSAHAPVHQSPLARLSNSSRASSVSDHRGKTPSPPSTRPNSPPVLSRSRVTSPSPQQIVRSFSADEKDRDRVHQRWLPMAAADPEFFNAKSSKPASPTKPITSGGPSRVISVAHSGNQPPRIGTPVSTR